MLAMAMEKREGVPLEEAKKKIFMRDSRGLIVKGRSSGGISRHKEVFAHEHVEMQDLAEIVKDVKPTVLIGAAAQPNVFTEQIIKDMCSFTGWNIEIIVVVIDVPLLRAPGDLCAFKPNLKSRVHGRAGDVLVSCPTRE